MLSVILYGRNDSYGYNLHKRAVISLNCIAEVLTAPGDEIIFVDYNTPDDFPTFPEAISDMLGERAKALLRILRVRPAQHERFREQSKLVALEPVARNVGLRRSNPENRWILSTNTDMVFVPRHAGSLSDIVAALPDAYYHLPRFEVPEPLWESFDRRDPSGTIAALRQAGCDMHLNEIVYSVHPEIRYDAPGDFQLMLRSDLWAIHGFHESMLLGFHVDSNIARRLSLLPRRIGDLVEELYGYHCQHLRQLTPAHTPRAAQNDVVTFHAVVERPDIPEQAQIWGLAGERVEELTVDTTSRSYLNAVRSVLGEPLVAPTLVNYSQVGNGLDYTAEHVIPFIAGIFSSYPRECRLGWIGSKRSLLVGFASVWKEMGFIEPLRVLGPSRWLGADLPPNCVWGTEGLLDQEAQAFVFDFGKPEFENAEEGLQLLSDPDDPSNVVSASFRSIVRRERQHSNDGPVTPRLFVGVNAMARQKTDEMFRGAVGAALSPLSTRVQHGFVGKPGASALPLDLAVFDEFDCMPFLLIGSAGVKAPISGRAGKEAIHAKPGLAGALSYGPYLPLVSGHYEAVFEFYGERPAGGTTVTVDVATQEGQRVVARQGIKPHKTLGKFADALKVRQGPFTCVLGFDVDENAMPGSERSFEFRVWSPGNIAFCLSALRIRQVATPLARPYGRDCSRSRAE